MTDDMMTLRTLLEKSSDAELLREMIGFTAERLTTSQPRSLLSIARLKSARSRVRRARCNWVRIAHTCRGWSGGFGPMYLPLFQGRADRKTIITSDQ